MRKIKSILLLVVLFVLSTGVFGQGLYEKNNDTSSDASFYSTSGEKPQLRAGGGDPPVVDPPKEPGDGPVGSGVWILMSLSGLYLSKVYFGNKKKRA